MADRTKIEWTRAPNGTPGATWNPITGCSVVSPGCTNCYAMRLAGTRLQHEPSRVGLTQPSKAGPVWTGEVRFNAHWLDQPLRWRRPRRIFVCAHGDLFHEAVPDEWIDRVFAVMQQCERHRFLVLTKRPARMRTYLEGLYAIADDNNHEWFTKGFCWPIGSAEEMAREKVVPFPNVWLGVSVEDQGRADDRIPALLATPAAKRFISAEPLLAPIDLGRHLNASARVRIISFEGDGPGAAALAGALLDEAMASPPMKPTQRLDWVIVGSESGPRARPCDIAWVRSLRDQCTAAGVAFFWKQHVIAGKKIGLPKLDGKQWAELPA